jgi:hypothetical protein
MLLDINFLGFAITENFFLERREFRRRLFQEYVFYDFKEIEL